MQEKNRDIILIYEMEIIWFKMLEIKHNYKILKILQV
jgi:hypothetical protein